MGKTKKIEVKGTEISIIDQNNVDFVSLTDMSKSENKKEVINKWLSTKNTVEFLIVWESMNNKDFKPPDIGGFGFSKNFYLSPKNWIEKTNAIGIFSKSGRYGGTYAHKDIAYHFGMWLSPEFQLLIIQEFDRLKTEEAERNEIGWDYRRTLTKVNYKLHTDSIRDNILPSLNIPYGFEGGIYATEAEILNYSVFGITAKEWKKINKNKIQKSKNLRDYANVHELTVLSNLEALNSKLIREGLSMDDRLITLEKEASFQLKSLYRNSQYTDKQIQSPNKKLA